MALLMLAHATGLDCEVATVNHGIRPEATAECALVERQCKELGIPCAIIDVMLAKGNLQQEARRVRYKALTHWAEQRGLAAILTAHHADDQAETLLMRLNRGSGLAGLGGIREARAIEGSEVVLLRPLLAFRRTELRRIVEEARIETADDPSNRDPAFDRVRMRDALAQAEWLDVDGLAHSAGLLADAQNTIDGLALEDWGLNAKPVPGGFTYEPFAASKIERRPVWIEVATMIAADIGAELTRGEAAKIVESLLDERKINVGGICASVSESGAAYLWRFEREAPRRTG